MSAPDTTQALAKYRLIAEIGHGGMADVYLAVIQGPAGFNKLVVIKKARKELAADPEFLAMFLDEARLAARLNHPNVVQTTEVGQEGDRYFIAMEYLDGQPLNRVRSRAGASFSTALQARVLSDVLAGLHHAHELCDFDGTQLGVVHRDATPQNVFVTYDGLIKVVDFGIAKAVDSSSETRQGVVKGKVTYMAPEQASGNKVDRRADVFAVGVMLWEAIAHRRMWKGHPDIVVIQQLVMGRIPSIRETVPDVPEDLALICERALSPNPADRYATALEMHEDLEGYLRYSEGTSARDVGKFVAEKFAEDRNKVKGLIESQLRDVRWSGAYPRVTGLDLPKIDPGQVVITPTGRQALESVSGVQSATGLRVAAASGSGMTNAGAILAEAPPPKPGKPMVLIGVGAVAAVAVIVLGVRFLAPGAPPPAPVAAGAGEATAVAAPREVPTPAAVAPAAGQDAVKLTVRVSPANAKVYLDDVLLSAGAFEGKVVKSDKVRRVRAEAAHYGSKEETVTLGGDVILAFALEKEAETRAPVGPGPGPRGRPAAPEPLAAAPPAAAPAPAPVPAPAATPAAAPTAGQKPKRAIDSDSPYAQ